MHIKRCKFVCSMNAVPHSSSNSITNQFLWMNSQQYVFFFLRVLVLYTQRTNGFSGFWMKKAEKYTAIIHFVGNACLHDSISCFVVHGCWMREIQQKENINAIYNPYTQRTNKICQNIEIKQTIASCSKKEAVFHWNVVVYATKCNSNSREKSSTLCLMSIEKWYTYTHTLAQSDKWMKKRNV